MVPGPGLSRDQQQKRGGLECVHRLTLAFELCMRRQPLVGLEPLIVSVCVYFCVCRRQMAKFTHHISWSCGSTDSRGTERSGGAGLWFLPLSSVPSGLPTLPSFLPSCMCPSHTLHTALAPTGLAPLTSSLRSMDRLLSQWKRKWMGGGPLATLTQLVRLIKRVCGLWVRAQTHQETVRPMTPLCGGIWSFIGLGRYAFLTI